MEDIISNIIIVYMFIIFTLGFLLMVLMIIKWIKEVIMDLKSRG